MKKEKKFPKELTGEVRTKIVLQKIAEGKSYTKVIDELVTEWGIKENVAREYVMESVKYLGSEEFREVVKGINTQRLEQIIQESMGTDNKTALKAIDLSNKTQGVYEEKIKLETENDIEVHFNV